MYHLYVSASIERMFSMKRISTIYSNVNLIADEFDIIVAIEENDEITFQLGDSVMVSGDSHGFITHGIRNAGLGTIIAFREDSTDYFVRVFMEVTHECGWVKTSRLKKYAF